MIKKVFVEHKRGYGEMISDEVRDMLRVLGKKVVRKPEERPDLAILVGGDGTMLKFQSILHCPILGINPGHSVGFYMTADRDDFRKKLLSVFNEDGKYRIIKVPRLEASVNGKRLKEPAMNDILASAVYTRRIFDSEVTVRGKAGIERNSGIIFYTPTGSRAFAMSAGAKPLGIDFPGFGLVALAPYSGNLKSGEAHIQAGDVTLKFLSAEGEICIDGQDTRVYPVKRNDTLKVKVSEKPAQIIGFGKDFKPSEPKEND